MNHCIAKTNTAADQAASNNTLCRPTANWESAINVEAFAIQPMLNQDCGAKQFSTRGCARAPRFMRKSPWSQQERLDRLAIYELAFPSRRTQHSPRRGQVEELQFRPCRQDPRCL